MSEDDVTLLLLQSYINCVKTIHICTINEVTFQKERTLWTSLRLSVLSLLVLQFQKWFFRVHLATYVSQLWQCSVGVRIFVNPFMTEWTKAIIFSKQKDRNG